MADVNCSELREGEKLAALIVDMDDFKDINDHYGHPMGDYVLKEAVDIMRHYAPAGARIGQNRRRRVYGAAGQP